MRATVALISKTAVLSLMPAYGPASAQDVAPETPPELRDFRLDPQPARPTAQPSVETAPVRPPPAVAVPDTAAPAPRAQTPTSAATRSTRPGPVAAAPANETPTTDTGRAAPAADLGPATADDVAPEVSLQPEAVNTASQNWLQIAAALGLIGIILIAFYRFRRSRAQVAQADADIVEPVTLAEPPKAVEPVKPAPPLAPSLSKSKPRIAIDFVPEKATISFTALTIKGQLRVINESDLVARNMLLRAALMSASANQEAEIAAFHQSGFEMPTENLGDAQPRERIGMAIELTVPLADLQSFPLGDQQLFVPIMVANLAYGGDDATPAEVAEIACMIGREADPPKPKMAPLRLDLGPRSFAPLGQRPVLTYVSNR